MDIYKKSFRSLNKKCLIKKMNNDIRFIDPNYVYTDEEVEKNITFIDFVNPDQFLNSNGYKYNFEWINKTLYVKDRPLVKPVFMYPTFSDQSFFSSTKKPDSLSKFSTNNNDEYIINNLFSQQKITNLQKSICYAFFEPLLMNELSKNTVPNEHLNKISRNIERIHYLKKNIESDDFGIISWKIYKSYSNFLLNYSLPFNLAYNMIGQNHFMNEKILYIKWNQLFLKILHLLLSIFFKFKNFFSFVNRIEFEKDLIEKHNELDILMSQLNKPNFYNLMRNHYYKYFNKLLNNLYFKEELSFDLEKIYKKNIKFVNTQYLGKRIVKKRFICSIQNIQYNKWIFQVYEWLYEMNNSKIFYFSKKMIPNHYHYFIKIKLPQILEISFRNSDSENINEVSNSLHIFANTRSINIVQNQLFKKYEKSLNKNFVKKFNKRDINNSIADSFITIVTNDISISKISSKNSPFNSIKNEELFPVPNYPLIFANYLLNYQSNYNERFLFHLRKTNIENNSIIYFAIFKIFKYNRFYPIIIELKFSFLQKKKYVRLTQLRLMNALLSKMLYKNSYKTKILPFPHFYKELSSPKNLYFSPSSDTAICSKQEINEIETIFCYKLLIKDLFIKTDSKKIIKDLIAHLNNTKMENYYNILRSKSLIGSRKRNSRTLESINKIFLYSRSKYFKLKDLKYKILRNTDKFYKYNQFEISSFFTRYSSLRNYNYNLWFFTLEWWEYHINIFIEKLRKKVLVIGYYFEYFINDNIEVTQKNLVSFLGKGKNLYNLNLKWNSRLFFDYEEETIFHFVWSDFQLINNCNSLHWVIFSLIVSISLFYQNYFSILIGSDSINLWNHFEIIKYLTDTSRAFYLTKLMHRNKTQLNKTENLVIYFFKNLKHYTKNIKFYLLTKKILNKWLISRKSLDLSRRKRNLLVQSLITHTRIKEYGFQLYPKQKLLNDGFDYQENNQQGLSYLKYLVRIFRKNLVNYPLHLADKWIFFASLQKIISSQTLRQAKKFNSKFQKIPIPFQFGLSCSKGILLIGPAETGRSYLIKNLAADSYVPLLGISINKLLYNKPDIITESWMNILIESLRRLNLILDLAKGMSPCIIWIRNIHQLDVNRSTQNIESDPTFLLGILLKHFQTYSIKNQTGNNIIMIGSTHAPKKVDPSLISPDRLDRIINIRLFSSYQRRNLFPILLNKNNLQLRKNLLYLNDFGSRTTGYNIRDLAALTNEISLISLTKNESFIYIDTIKLAFHRQVFGFTHKNNKPNFHQNLKILLYKIGRTITQNILIEGSVTNPLNIGNYLWKKNFYYLSKWYSEPYIDESIIKESTILIHVLSCLAGIAARDSWFLSEKDYHTSIPLDKLIENDLELAFGILENFSIEFPRLETCEIHKIDEQKTKDVLNNKFLSIMQNGIFAIANRSIRNNSQLVSQHKIVNNKSCEFKNIAWSPRFWRLSFSRSNFFDWMKRPNDLKFFHNFEFSKKHNLENKNHYGQLIGNKKEQLLYERILPRIKKRNVQELESQFEEILLEEQFEILGFFCSSTQYRMEYQLINKPRLFVGKRILWDPVGSFFQIRHFVFSRREFFVDEEMLRRLYVTYGVRRERERSLSSHRIKRFFICRGYNKDFINKLSVRWWNQLPIDQKQNIYTLKRIEKIGIRLKRPQIFTPVYLYQRWLIENIPEKFSRLELLTYRDRLFKINKLLLNDSFTYTTLLESYQYLFEFFLSNKILLNRMIEMLLRKKWLFKNEIGDIIHSMKKY
uniref:Protein Ycf2 n=1 Tax=Ptilidium pulcherrimum TaxID=3143427 RepID=F5GUZ7_9MARC|nr:hypothetical chloroplast RF21 [Ptilidium ciliare var. pulcherrimum]ADK89599.1 hypothetical chloroplast RF21 [Ptilidium ciliare var. pulcherrimum]